MTGTETGTAGMLAYFGGALGVGGLAVWASGRRELKRRWLGWALCAVALGGTLAFGRPGAAALAAALGAVAAAEYVRLQRLPLCDGVVLIGLELALPFAAWLAPTAVWRVALGGAVLLALVPVLDGDAPTGARRAAASVFGLLWLAPLTGLVLLGRAALPLCFAVALADVGAWCGGTLLGGPRLSPLSPAKRRGGVLGAAVLGLGALAATGALTPVTAVAVVAAAPLGDLLESMLKRGAGVKDAAAWLPGFGGLLDRVDSLLLALAVAVIL